MMKMGPDDMRAMDLKNNKLGVHCHSFMPAGMEGPINCMWECKVDDSLYPYPSLPLPLPLPLTLPSSTLTLPLSLTLAKVDTAPEVFQAFIDGPDGPGPGVVINKCYKVMPWF